MMRQIFTTEPPAEGLRQATSCQGEASAITASVSGFSPSHQQSQPPQVQQGKQAMYARAGNPEIMTVMPTYATIPARASTHGQVLRSSSSQDHLQAGSLHVRSSYQVAYPVPSERVVPPHFPHPSSGPTPGTFRDQSSPMNGTRPPRPLAVYQPWNSATQQPPFVQGLDVASPPSSGSSSDSGTQAVVVRSPSSSPSNAVFYAYGPTRPPLPLTQAPPPPIPPVPAAPPAVSGRRVRALYNCVGENPAELSFEPNAIIVNGMFPDSMSRTRG